MAVQSRAGMAQVVTGLVRPEELGVTLTHEHLMSDAAVLVPPPPQASLRDMHFRPVAMETFAYAKHYSDVIHNFEDFVLRDVDTAIDELMIYRQFGGDSMVECSSIGLGRDPVALARISRATGVNIVMGASYYVATSHPPDMDDISEEEITEQIVRDVTEGVDGTHIRSGVIGEIGCTYPLTPNERKVLRASGRAQKITGAPLLVHPGRDVTAPLHNLEVLVEGGADPSNVILGHLDRTFVDFEEFKRVAEAGCFVEWDLIGEERSFYDGNPAFDMPTDAVRMDQIAWVISEGYGDRILVAHDIAYKHRYMRHGGHGYGYILSHLVPRMRDRGIDDDDIDRILVDNPRRALTFAEPRPD